jgi:Ca2+/H+ antiporter, TMEM165/GDT1 family
MPAFFLALLAAALLSLGGRDQLMLSRLAQVRRGGTGALVAVALLVTALSSGLMAWGGSVVATLLPGAAKSMLVAFALAAAAVELVWPRKNPVPAEPTHSLFALFVVLLARQIGDAARFGVFALAAATGVPILSALGGWIGGAAVLLTAVLAADDLADPARLQPVRWVLAAACGVAALVTGLGARGLV